MKPTRVLLTALFLLFPFTLPAAPSASATLFCWSLRFHQGEGSFDETLDLSSVAGAPNGELVPWYATYTHRTSFTLDYSGFPITGTLYLDLPPNPDANNNGFDDSFEVSQAAGGTSYGEYTTALGGGSVVASWNRGAGSKEGTCSLHLVDDAFGDLGSYQHGFEVLEYTGTLSYTPGTNTVSGSVNLTNALDQLQGAINFIKSPADPGNQLTLQAGGWTNATLQTPAYASRSFSRDVAWPTNYYGMIVFDDGDLNTGTADYRSWELSIDDLNDSDHDGIPDFSDEPAAVVPPRAPQLSLGFNGANLQLSISGDTNRLHFLLENTSLASGNWVTNRSLTLSSDPQTVSLEAPVAPAKFWRVLAVP